MIFSNFKRQNHVCATAIALGIVGGMITVPLSAEAADIAGGKTTSSNIQGCVNNAPYHL